MRILLAGTCGGENGIETYTRATARALSEAGHEVFLASRVEPDAEFDLDSGLIRRSPVSSHAWKLRRIIGPLETFRVHRGLRLLVRSLGADVVHATYPEFAPSRVAPLVVTAWHPEIEIHRRLPLALRRGEGGWSSVLFALSDRYAFRRATAIIAVARSVRDMLMRRRLPAVWIPPFVQDAWIHPVTPSRPPTCVMVSRWLDHPRKGLDLAVQAVRRARIEIGSLRLILVGGWLDPRRIGELPDFCDTTGPLSRGAVVSVLRDAGCLLLPSIWEEFGYVGLEALAAGIPVVAGPLPGYEGLSTNGIVVVSARDPNYYAEAIWKALTTTRFEFPDECRASVATRRIQAVYEAVA